MGEGIRKKKLGGRLANEFARGPVGRWANEFARRRAWRLMGNGIVRREPGGQ